MIKQIKGMMAMLLLMCSMTAYAVEIMVWERMPLAVPLQVGQERVIFVESNVRVGVPSSLTNKLRVQSTGGNIYLLALEPIAPTRIQLQDAQTGALILMDIVAHVPTDNSSPLEPIQIIEGDHTPVRYGRHLATTSTPSTNKPVITVDGNATKIHHLSQQRETPIPVVLTRYAAQNLYAPLRTVEPVTGISQVNLDHRLDLQALLPMLPIQAKAIAAWRLDNYWVTAVLLQSTTSQTLILDPRLLQGDFVAATFQHTTLGAVGQSTDTTIVYLVTRQHGLAQSLLPNLSQINAQRNVTGATHEK